MINLKLNQEIPMLKDLEKNIPNPKRINQTKNLNSFFSGQVWTNLLHLKSRI